MSADHFFIVKASLFQHLLSLFLCKIFLRILVVELCIKLLNLLCFNDWFIDLFLSRDLLVDACYTYKRFFLFNKWWSEGL